jgi:IS30 family transposase
VRPHPLPAPLPLLLPQRESSATTAALDSLETTLEHATFQRLLGLVLTDNGTKFAYTDTLEKSSLGSGRRLEVYYCDMRQSQQKGGCERNHVELRKLLPKGRGISFKRLDERDLAVAMSNLNSEPRPSLAELSPMKMLRVAYGESAQTLHAARGIEDIPNEKLILSPRVVEDSHEERGLPSLRD